MIDIVAAGGLLALGREGENEAVRIVLLNSWPDAGAVLVLHQRATDKLPHPVTTTEENGNIYWVVGAADTEAPGFGRAEVRWLDDAGRIVKSRVYQTYVDKSIASPSAAPDSWETYVNQVAKDAAAAKEAAKAAAEAKEAAESAANLAETAEKNALDYKDYAERACKDAQSAKGGAVSAASQADAASKQAQSAASAAASSAASAASSAESAEEAAQKAEDALAAVPGAVQTAAGPLVSQAAASASAASASATAAAASAESVKASAEQITANKEAIETITPDDTAIDGKPWTSKKIVDTLCPPIEETGNPVQCYPVPGYPLGVTASWEPGQEGEGEPSPENIRPITGRNSVTVERCGENLLDISQLKPEGYNLAGSNTLKSNTTYTFKPVSCGGIYFSVFITDNIVPSQTTKQLNLTKTYIKEGDSATFTTPSDTDSYSVMWLTGNKPGIDRIYPNVQFMLVAGTTAPTAYTPYTGQTNTLTLPETVYGGEVDAVSGEGQETWKLLTLDGTENWRKYGNTSDESRASCFTCDIDDKDIGYGTSVCNKFVNVKNSDPFNSQQMKEFTYTDHPNIKNIYMNYGDNQTVPLDEWKAYLAAQYAAGTPVQVCYKLATPIPFTATGAQQLPALAGLNTVLTDADSVTVAGRADPIKRITDLEDAVASQT